MMGDVRDFENARKKKAMHEALVSLAADDVPYIQTTVDGIAVMIVSDDLNRKMNDVAAAVLAGAHVMTYSEYLRDVSAAN